MRTALLLIPAGLFAALPATADELPKRKPGLWEVAMAIEGQKIPFSTLQQCTDEETDALMMTNFNGAIGQNCSQPEVRNSGGTYTIDSTCTFSGATTSTHAVISGDFDKAYTVKVTSKQTGGKPLPTLGAGGEMNMALEAKWVGPCGPKMKPGDIVMPGGITVNIRQLKIRP